MPRRLPVRPAKVFGNFFVLIVLSVIFFIYYVTMILTFGPRAQSKLHFWRVELVSLWSDFNHSFFEQRTSDGYRFWSFTTSCSWCCSGPSSRRWPLILGKFQFSGASTWVTTRTRGEGIAWCATCSSQRGAITAQPATDAFWTWTITAHGLTTVLDSGTESTSCCFWSTFLFVLTLLLALWLTTSTRPSCGDTPTAFSQRTHRS